MMIYARTNAELYERHDSSRDASAFIYNDCFSLSTVEIRAQFENIIKPNNYQLLWTWSVLEALMVCNEVPFLKSRTHYRPSRHIVKSHPQSCAQQKRSVEQSHTPLISNSNSKASQSIVGINWIALVTNAPYFRVLKDLALKSLRKTILQMLGNSSVYVQVSTII